MIRVVQYEKSSKRNVKSNTSFLFAFLSVFLALASRSLISSLFGLGLSLSLESSHLFLHDFLVLLDGFRVHLDGGMAEPTVVSIPVLTHEDAGSA